MVQEIWKYTLEVFNNELEIPEGSEILDVQMQGDHPCLWALVDPQKTREKRIFHLIGTGHPIFSSSLSYIATVQIGHLVWHIFEESIGI